MKAYWKYKSEKLFFNSRLKIKDIAAELGVSRKTIAAYLKSCDGFNEEKQRRKNENAEKRKEYQYNWDKTKRKTSENTDAAMLKRQHETDVRVLSYERFFNEQ